MMNQRLQAPLSQWDTHTDFAARHIGPAAADEAHMLQVIGQSSRHALMQAVVPASIALQHPMDLPPAATEAEALQELKSIACRNRILKSFIGQGYYGTHTPGVIQRNILENPAWYTAYTPYQAEISQGRLEALLNFQTMVCDLTAMPIANASMLDEATAAAEAMALAQRSARSQSTVFVVHPDVHPQTLKCCAPAPPPWAGRSASQTPMRHFSPHCKRRTLGRWCNTPAVQAPSMTGRKRPACAMHSKPCW